MLAVRVLNKLIGRTIKAIVVSDLGRRAPEQCMLIVFEDDSYFELYGNDMDISRTLGDGGVKHAVEYAGGNKGYVTQYPEPSP